MLQWQSGNVFMKTHKAKMEIGLTAASVLFWRIQTAAAAAATALRVKYKLDLKLNNTREVKSQVKSRQGMEKL